MRNGDKFVENSTVDKNCYERKVFVMKVLCKVNLLTVEAKIKPERQALLIAGYREPFPLCQNSPSQTILLTKSIYFVEHTFFSQISVSLQVNNTKKKESVQTGIHYIARNHFYIEQIII